MNQHILCIVIEKKIAKKNAFYKNTLIFVFLNAYEKLKLLLSFAKTLEFLFT